MGDIVQRLQEGIDPLDIPEGERAMDAGADEIARLRADNAKMRDALLQSREAYGALICVVGYALGDAAPDEQKAAPEGECPDCGEPLATGNHKDDCKQVQE